MSSHVDILEQSDPLRKPLLGSIALHAIVFAAVLATSLAGSRGRQAWGDLNSGGPGSIAINVVNKIPLPARSGIVNPLANDTESSVPKPPPKAREQREVKAPEPEAVPLKSRNATRRESRMASSQAPFRAQPQERSNQLYSTSGPAMVSPMIGQTGSGGVGVGTGSPFGNRYGWYVSLLRDKVARSWHTTDVDARLKTAPPVIIMFTILRDGSVPPSSVRIIQRSGNAALDYSAQRAVYDASPFPALPPGYERDQADVEFWFELRR